MSWHPPETDAHRPKKKRDGVKLTGTPQNDGERLVMHVDMDAFFAAIEQRDQPQLRGKPVIVGGLPGERSVVSTCSYEARAFGVHSGMPLAEAERLCPHAEFIRTHGSKYVHASIKIIETFHRYTPAVEPVSIDEAYLDVTGSIRLYGDEQRIAEAMKNDIFDRLGLTCSVGIAPTRVFAKLASGLDKPDGLTIIKKEDYETKIYPLTVRKLWGIGEKTEIALNKYGIFTIGELAEYPEKPLKKYFGVYGEALRKTARGESSSVVTPAVEREDEKSVGNEHTFHADVGDEDTINSMLLYLSQKVGRRARKEGFAGRTVTLKLRYADFETHTHRETFPQLIWDDYDIYQAASMLLDQIYVRSRRIRLLGISISGLVRNGSNLVEPKCQTDMFHETGSRKNYLPVFDGLREKFGERIISRTGAQRSSRR